MEEGKRQKQIAGLLNEEMNTIFQRLGLSMIDGGMISISAVKVTPDLLEARFYLSLFQVKDVEAALAKIESRHHEIKKELASNVRPAAPGRAQRPRRRRRRPRLLRPLRPDAGAAVAPHPALPCR